MKSKTSSETHENLTNCLVKVYLKSGNVFAGMVKKWTNEKVILISPGGEEYIIYNPTKNVDALSYTRNNDGEIVKGKIKEKSTNLPTHKPGDIDSLVELRKLAHEEDLKEVQSRIIKSTNTGEVTQYASQLSTLLSSKNYTGK